MVRGKPPVEDFSDFDLPHSKSEAPWGFFSPVSGIALDLNLHRDVVVVTLAIVPWSVIARAGTVDSYGQ